MILLIYYSLWKISKLNLDNIFIGENASLITESRIGNAISYEVNNMVLDDRHTSLIKSIFYDFEYFSWLCIDTKNLSKYRMHTCEYIERIISRKNSSIAKIKNNISSNSQSINIRTSYRSLLINFVNSNEDKFFENTYSSHFSQFIKAMKTLAPIVHARDNVSIETVEASNKDVYIHIPGKSTNTNRHIALSNELSKNINFSFMPEDSNELLRFIFAKNMIKLISNIIDVGDIIIRYDNEKEVIFNDMFRKFIKNSYTEDGFINAPKYNDYPLFHTSTRIYNNNVIIRPFKMCHIIELLNYTFQYSKDESGNKIIKGFELDKKDESLMTLLTKIVYGLR